MAEYLSPGVYVEEVDIGPKPIEGVGTATAAFIGFTEKAEAKERVDGEIVTRDLLNRPQLVTNWTQYTDHFGNFVDGAHLPQAVYGFFTNGGTRCYVISVKTMPKAEAALLNVEGKPQLIVQARQAGYEGARLRVRVDVPQLTAPASAEKEADPKQEKAGEKKTASSPAPETPASFTLTVEREKLSGGWQVKEVVRDITLVETTTDNGVKTVRVAYKDRKAPQLVSLLLPAANTPLAKLWPRAQQQSLNIPKAQLPAPTAANFQGDVSERTGLQGLEALDDVTIISVPDLMTTAPGEKLDLDMIKAVQGAMISHCERLGGRVAIIDPPPGLSPQQVRGWRLNDTNYDSGYAALYYPWLAVRDAVSGRTIQVPPSGHMAGVWARVDGTRGVHKAPANEPIQGIAGVVTNITRGEQDTLNPIGVNCIRSFPGMGLRIWGARTLSSNPAWRYINIRRLFNFVERSIELGTQWVVFEPNNERLWSLVTRDISGFLNALWTSGALFGSTPAQAFYVKCDAELNPPESRDQGKLVVEVGLAPVKPAEFVIFRITQWLPGAQESATEESGGEAEESGA